MPRIVFKKSEHPPVDLVEAVTLGRSASHANVMIADNRLSRAHCRFEPREDGWAVVDLESQNGTFLNGRRVRESILKLGDVVTIGACDMLFEETGGPGANTVMAGVQSSRGTQGLDLADESVASPTPEKQDSTRTVVAPAALVLVKGTLLDKIHPLTHDPFKIGRKHDNQLCLENDGKASGHHAHIIRDGMNYVIEDLGSTNGVVVNGKKIEGPVVLKPGMKVLLGQQLFKFELQGKDAVSSGRTAPEIASADIQARLKPPGQAGDVSDLDDPAPAMEEADEAGEPATIAASPAEQRVLNEDDEERAVLRQHVAYKGGSGGLFAVVEAIVVVAVGAAILFAAWTMLSDDNQGAGTGGDNYPPARDGGLLATNPSFDEADEGGYARGWSYIVSGTDSFTLVEGAHGGQYAMQIARIAAANEASYVVSDRIDVTGSGIEVSAFAINSEAAAERLGSAQITVLWYAHKRESEPMRVTPITALTNMREWTEIKGSAAAPEGARQFAIALGMMGTQGSVAFDDVTVSAVTDATNLFPENQQGVDGGMTWRFGPDGELSLDGPDGTYFRGGRFLLYQTQQHSDPLDVLDMLVEPPSINKTDNRLYAKYVYFDPIAGANFALNMELGSNDGGAKLTASVSPTGATGADKGARYVSLHILATPSWVPAEFVRLGSENPRLREYAMELGIGASRSDFKQLLSANTGTCNAITAGSGDLPRLSALRHPSGREMSFVRNGSLDLTFTRGTEREELSERAALVSDVQPGEDQMDRVDRAVSIFKDFLYNDNEIATAAAAIDAAGKHYSLRLIELRDGINVPQLTRNEQLYRAAMEEAITTADKLNVNSDRWDRDSLKLLSGAINDAMLMRTRESATLARSSLRELIDLAKSFEQLAAIARKALFTLEVEIEQRESEPYMVSARDFLDSGQYVQGMLKLHAVVLNYPRCLRGIEAKERMVDVASILLDQMDDYKRQKLTNIAADRAQQARELLKLVEDKLLTNILSDREKGWLRDPDLPPELKTGDWVSRENDLMTRINKLRLRLPPEEK